MRRESEEETIECLNSYLEMIVDDMRYDIEIEKIPNFKYMVDMLVEETGSNREKIVEGLTRWHSGIYRRNG
jgi:hypothetical protein